MDRIAKITVVMFLSFLFLYVGFGASVANAAETTSAKSKAEIKKEEEKAKAAAKAKREREKKALQKREREEKARAGREKKAREAEALEDRKEAAEKAGREKAELERKKAKAKAKARAEAEKLAKLDAEAKKQAQIEIAQAKSEMKAKLAELNAKAADQAKDIKAESSRLRSNFDNDKAKLAVQYKELTAKADKKEKADLDAEYKGKKRKLETEYKQGAASLKEKEKKQKAEISQAKTMAEAEYKEKVAKIEFRRKSQMTKATIEKLNLPEDKTARLAVKEVKISGNILVPNAEVVKKMPLVYNASDEPLEKAEPDALYDFTVLGDVILDPGKERQISARTIQGFTQYILSLYQERNYAGIYVYVPREALIEGKELKDGVLLVEVLEAPVTEVTVKSYDPDQNEKEKGYLRRSVLHEWSPVKSGQVANQKELDDFVNLLNLNPDRYVSAIVTKGAKPNSLAVSYDVYEANPWHWFIQVDNSGTKDKQWVPRLGLINTNLLGIDDTFVAIWQAPWDSHIDDDYSLYGSYDFPLMGPKLRLNLYGGYSQFDISPDAGEIDFIGNGSFYGGVLRYNALQTEPDTWLLGDGWFFDIKGMVEHTRSKVTPSLFPTWLATDIKFWLWGWGLELHRSDDVSNSSVGFDRWESWGGESDASEFALARTGSKSDFSIYSFYANHSQYIDPNKVGRLSGNFRWIGSNERLAPAKMTSFGGMYTVRGYDEYELVADGGILASVQYEYDLIALEESKKSQEQKSKELQAKEKQNQLTNQLTVKKLAPLVFMDYGRTTVVHPIAGIGEKRHEELCSIGVGTVLELGDHFSGGVYYGYPLIATPDTRRGKGRLNVGAMLRW